MKHLHKLRPQVCSFPSSNLGYALIELMTTLTIAAILAAMASSVWGFLEGQRLVALNNEVIANLHFARSEAIRTNERISLCQSADQSTCGRSDQWEKGWIIFRDLNENRVVDSEDTIITSHGPLPKPYRLRWRASANSNYYLSFLPRGQSNKSGTFILCGPTEDPDAGRFIIVYRSGRVRWGLMQDRYRKKSVCT